MMHHAIVAYRRRPHVDAACELRNLGLEFAERFLVFWQDIVVGRVDHWMFQPFRMFGKVPIYKVESYQRFALFAVVEESDDSTTIIVMLAARRGDATIGGHVWDGSDMTFVRDTVLHPRLADCFTTKRKP